MNEEPLKLCPCRYCGGEPTLKNLTTFDNNGAWKVICHHCAASGPTRDCPNEAQCMWDGASEVSAVSALADFVLEQAKTWDEDRRECFRRSQITICGHEADEHKREMNVSAALRDAYLKVLCRMETLGLAKKPGGDQ